MKHDHDTFKEFKRRYNRLLNEPNQSQTTKIFNMTQFHEYLAGNIPETFEKFFLMLEEAFPNNINIINNFDQNKIMKEEVHKYYDLYKPETPRELFNIISLQDIEYVKLNNGLYDMLKTYFIDKYPRVIQQIEALQGRVPFLELYLHNYKRMLVEVVKMDNFITYFVNDLFKSYLTGAAFKLEFFDPVMDMFQKYFFKAELSYQNSDALLQTIRDKMQQVTCGSEHTVLTDLNNIFSELLIRDKKSYHVVSNNKTSLTTDDTWVVHVINDEIHTFSKENDDVYKK
jgi:hypothetical protein